jgi:hypothetical protein
MQLAGGYAGGRHGVRLAGPGIADFYDILRQPPPQR